MPRNLERMPLETGTGICQEIYYALFIKYIAAIYKQCPQLFIKKNQSENLPLF